jgi:hypothetical protein
MLGSGDGRTLHLGRDFRAAELAWGGVQTHPKLEHFLGVNIAMAKKRHASTLSYSSSSTGNSAYNPASLLRNNTSNASEDLR